MEADVTIKRRTLIAFSTGALVSGAALPRFARGAAPDRVTVQLDWIVRGDHAMFFVGKEKGYFADNGIDVTSIHRGTGTGNALRLVAAGNADFGFGDLPTLIVTRTHGVKNEALIAVNQESPMAIIAVAQRHKLSKPQDLKGLRVGADPGSASAYLFLKAFLHVNGMSLSDIELRTVSAPYSNYLLLNRVDAIPGYIDAEVPTLEAETGGPGSLSILLGTSYGIHSYGSGVFASEAHIRSNPDLVQRFVKGYLRAFEYVIANPKEAVEIIVAANPEYKGKESVLSAQLEADIRHTFFSPDTKAQGIGIITKQGWSGTTETLKREGLLEASASPEGGFDNRFVIAANPQRR